MSGFEIETFEHADLTVRIVAEEDGSPFDPRDWDNLGTMVCWHPDYVLGDFQLSNTEGRGAVSSVFETEHGRTDFRDMAVLERYLRVAHKAVAILPLYLFDHSGISMSAGRPCPFDNPVVRRDHHGAGLGWDSSMVGYVFTTAERIAELCNGPVRDGDPFYCPRDWEGSARAWVESQLAAEVKTYSAWLEGDVTCYVIEDEDGEVLEACGGYVGEVDFCRSEARIAAEGERARIDREADVEARESAYWAARDVATVG